MPVELRKSVKVRVDKPTFMQVIRQNLPPPYNQVTEADLESLGIDPRDSSKILIVLTERSES